MSFDPTPNANTAKKRQVKFSPTIVNLSSLTLTNTEHSPIAAALQVSARHIATLHSDLNEFLMSLSQASLTAYSEYHQNTVKNKELCLNPHQIPTSIKKLKLVIQPLDEIKESEGIKALQQELDADTEEFHRKLRDKYVIPINALNNKAFERRFHFTVLKMLRKAAQAFIAQLDINEYNEDTAVIDLLTTRTLEPTKAPLPLDISELLQLYKDASSEDVLKLPLPSKFDENIHSIINNINRDPTTTINAATNLNPPGGAATTTVVTNSAFDSQSPASSMTNSVTHTSELISPGHHTTNMVTPHTGQASNERQPWQLPTTTPPSGFPAITPPNIPTIRGTEFVTANSFARSLINNLETEHQFTEDSENTQNETTNENEYGNTQYDDTTYTELDLASIDQQTKQQQVINMLQGLYLNTIKLPIDEYHTTLFKQGERLRIKRVTSSSLKSSLTAKVASKIQAERPADRPTLSGLIREETNRNTSELWSQLKSATDTLRFVKQKQMDMIKEFHLKQTQQTPKQTPSTTKKQGGSNKKNRVWSRSNTGSTVAAETLPTNSSKSQTIPQQGQQRQGNNQGWGRKRQPPTFTPTDQDSPTVGDNVSSAARRVQYGKKRRLNHNKNANNEY